MLFVSEQFVCSHAFNMMIEPTDMDIDFSVYRYVVACVVAAKVFVMIVGK